MGRILILNYPSIAFLLVLTLQINASGDWLQFRGNSSNSDAGNMAAPTEWSLESGENVAWSAQLPGRGPASPIVVQDRVIVTCSSGGRQQKLHVLALDARNGKRIWHRQFWATGRTECHPTSANAAPTPASDGQLIVALFSSCDLVCLDLDGNLQWYRGLALDYPKAGNDVGMSSSPLIVGDTVVAQIEAQGDSFVEGVDKTTGETIWRLQRPTESNWCSPTVMRDPASGNEQLILQSGGEVAAHSPESGATIWKHNAEMNSIASASPAGALILVPANGLTALHWSPTSTQPEVAWRENRLAAATASPVVHRNRIYVVNRGGVVVCADLTTGEILWRKRLDGSYWATPVAMGNQFYAANDKGQVTVIDLANEGQVLAENQLNERIQATPAVSGDAIYFRSDGHLWKIAETHDRK